MNAALYRHFARPFAVEPVPDPEPPEDGVVIAVRATGLCRSDWHGWMGHDPTIALPHVPGHEFAGVVAAVGSGVRGWATGDRVTVPFICACGACAQCAAGDQQVCPNQTQPGFTHWGSFAELVAIDHADQNLVRLPDGVDFATAASLGCRFSTAFRAVVDQGRARAGEWVVVHGCGGVGLSAIMIAAALGARVVAVDIREPALELARELGAEVALDARRGDMAPTILERTGGGAHLSLDALGSTETCRASIQSLRPRGRHVQVGLLLGKDEDPPLPMGRVVAQELELLGSHGMQAHRYDALFQMMEAGLLEPQRLVRERITLEEAPEALAALGGFAPVGVQ
ncbi:MAG: alcohol dehydrogenase, partial [Gemmatimonadales bacterium]